MKKCSRKGCGRDSIYLIMNLGLELCELHYEILSGSWRGDMKPCCKSSCSCCVVLGAQIRDLIRQNTLLREIIQVGIKDSQESTKTLRETLERLEREIKINDPR